MCHKTPDSEMAFDTFSYLRVNKMKHFACQKFYRVCKLTYKTLFHFVDTPVITKMIHDRIGQGHEPRRRDSIASTVRWAGQIKLDIR